MRSPKSPDFGRRSPQDRAQALDAARSHRRDWVEGYRGELGFVTAVLHDTRTG